MKKIILFFLTDLLISILFISCSNSANSSTAINVTEDSCEEINSSYAQTILADQEYDLSAFSGKRAFLIVSNNSDSEATITESRSSNISNVNGNYSSISDAEGNQILQSNINENQVFHIPYQAPKLNIPVSINSQNRNAINRSLNASNSLVTYNLGDSKDFYSTTSDDVVTTEYASGAVLKVIGEHCYVWYKAKDGIELEDSEFQSLADTFDSIYEKETYIFGKSYYEECNLDKVIDITSEEKIHLIIYDLYDDYQTSQDSGTLGFFLPKDFLRNGSWDGVTISGSNQIPCLHLDSYFLWYSPQALYSIVTHEFQHLIHFVNKSIKYCVQNGGDLRQTADWFNEMMSMVCEDIMQTQLDPNNTYGDIYSPKSRIYQFNPAYTIGFRSWINSGEQNSDTYSYYANAYVFGAYLLRNFGIDFIKEVAQNNYRDEEAITQALVSTEASLTSFNAALDEFYNVILHPEGGDYTLNKSVSKSYTISGSPVSFTCSAINLRNYLTFDGSIMSSSLANLYYGAVRRNPYYGPLILNKLYYDRIIPYGFFISYWGRVGEESLPVNYSLSSKINSNSNMLSYKLVFMD
ncbi:MAG: hypothetical protein K6C97_04380 [Treponema sp.]|nr:hypothetical protein [Treponema sp.]